MYTFKQFFEQEETIASRDVNPTAVALLKNLEGKYLILQRGPTAPWMPNKWGLPGGKVEDGETPKNAAFRETQEETNTSPNNLTLGEKINYPDNTLYFFTGTISEEPKLNYEHSRYAFIEKTDLNKYDFIPELATTLKKYM